MESLVLSGPSNSFPKKPPGGVRVLHTADWHLGKTLAGLTREEEHLRWLDFLLSVIQQSEADVLIIAGDVFDSANPPQSAQERYYTFLSRVYQSTSCEVVVVAGNHDSPAQLEAPKRVLQTLRVRVVGTVAENPEDQLIPIPAASADSVSAPTASACSSQPQLVVAAVPFLRDRDVRTGQPGQSASEIRAEILEGIRTRYQQIADAAHRRYPSVPVIATGHLTIDGARVTDSEREIHIGGLGAVSHEIFSEAFSYVALGHLHVAQQAGGRDSVRYSGSPFPLSFSEAGDQKELRLIDIASGVLLNNVAVPIPLQRYLMQLHCCRADLTQKLTSFNPPAGDLETWVEVIVSDPVAGENLFELVQEATKDKPWKVVRVLGQKIQRPASITSKEETAVESSLLERPSEVFQVRLQSESGLSDEERTSLTLAFQELVSLHREKQRESEQAETPKLIEPAEDTEPTKTPKAKTKGRSAETSQ